MLVVELVFTLKSDKNYGLSWPRKHMAYQNSGAGPEHFFSSINGNFLMNSILIIRKL